MVKDESRSEGGSLAQVSQGGGVAGGRLQFDQDLSKDPEAAAVPLPSKLTQPIQVPNNPVQFNPQAMSRPLLIL